MPSENPYLGPAVEAITGESPNGKVSDSLTFILTRVLTSNDPASAYAPDLVRCVAALTGKEQRECGKKLKARFGPEVNLNQWNTDVRDARAKLLAAGPSSLLKSESGATRALLANAIIQLRESPVDLAYDSFSSRVVIQNRAPWGSDGPWKDYDDVGCCNYLQHSGVAVASAVANEAAYYLAYQKPFHPVRDWLYGLKWDGTPRLDTWMVDYLGAHDDCYMRGIAAKWMLSAVARVMRPGCKADYMIVLEGPQRAGKSRALRALTNGHLDGDSGVQWFRDSLPDIEKDDIGLYMQGVWIIEVAELEAIRGKQWTKVKAFISSQTDTFRRKFGRNMADYPRQCVFAASTNESHWGGDHTGLTRFWPVAAEHIDVDGILRERDQLWAEARFRYDEGETWWLDEQTEQLAKIEQADRSPDDSWTERVNHAIGQFVDEISVAGVLDKLGVSIDKQDQLMSNRVSRALHMMGWTRFR